jgi:hypothetical protein
MFFGLPRPLVARGAGRQDRRQGRPVGRLREVRVESCAGGPLLVLFLAEAGQRHQDDAVAQHTTYPLTGFVANFQSSSISPGAASAEPKELGRTPKRSATSRLKRRVLDCRCVDASVTQRLNCAAPMAMNSRAIEHLGSADRRLESGGRDVRNSTRHLSLFQAC